MLQKFKLLAIYMALSVSVAANAQVRELRIGAMAELTGTYSSIGEECQRGYQIAENAFAKSSDTSIQVVYGDHQRQPKVGINEFWKLLREEDPVAIVSNAAPVILAINPLSLQQKIPFAGTVVHPNFVSDNLYAYRFWPTAAVEGSTIASKLHQLGYKKLAMIVLQDDYPVLISKEVSTTYESLGNKVVFSEDVVAEQQDYSSLISRLHFSQPDVIFVNILGSQLAIVLRRLREQGFDQPVVGTFSLGRADIREVAGASAEGAIFVEIDGNKPKFLNTLKDKFQVTKSTGMNYACYAALGTVLQTIRLNPSVVDRITLQKVLSSQVEVPLLDGNISIKDRQAKFDLIFRIVRKDNIENLG